MAARSVYIYEKCSFFNIVNHLDPFPYVFWAYESLILELHEMIRVLHVVALPMDFNLLCFLGREL